MQRLKSIQFYTSGKRKVIFSSSNVIYPFFYKFLFRNNKQPYQDKAEQIDINTNGNNSDSESDGENDSSDSSSDDESSENYQEKGPSFASSNDIESDHRFYDQSRYEKMYTWLYYNQSERGYMCKVCEVYYRNSPHFSGSNRGAWSHVSVKFNDNLGKKI